MVVLATAVIGGQTDLVASAGGRTLYTYDSDVAGSGVSNCVNGCATVWPPLTVGAGVSPAGGAGVTGQVGTIRRADGSIQVTYGGRPLYAYSGDTGPGTTNGSYAGWSIARP
ncbi:MAG TPA: hypothetical protein VFO60_03335 [Candidatus Dormibacteraeota bacterium]|nr:hypothetical protein [Candidatus Dormibacteraeota bacterium]